MTVSDVGSFCFRRELSPGRAHRDIADPTLTLRTLTGWPAPSSDGRETTCARRSPGLWAVVDPRLHLVLFSVWVVVHGCEKLWAAVITRSLQKGNWNELRISDC